MMSLKRICLWLLVIAVSGVIFIFSAMSGSDSMKLSGGFTDWFIHLFHPDYELLCAYKQEQIYRLFVLIVRKTAHFTEFAALGVSLLLLLRDYRLNHTGVWAWGLGTLYAGTDELHQYFNGTRTPSLQDVAIDSSGVLFGVCLLTLFLYILARRKKQKSA